MSTERISPKHDGARILWRLWFAAKTSASEAWVREFSPSCDFVRLSYTESKRDAGVWFESRLVVVDALLDPAKAPAPAAAEERESDDAAS